MTTFEIIKFLSEKRGKNVKEVAKELGFGENAFYKWKTSSPSAENLKKVAEYFEVSTDYLLGREETERIKEVDLRDDDVVFAFDGHKVTAEEKAMLRSVIEAYRKNK